MRLGVRREHIIMCDRAGVIYEGRGADMDPYKARFQVKTEGSGEYCGGRCTRPSRATQPPSSAHRPNSSNRAGKAGAAEVFSGALSISIEVFGS